ncbi:MAG: ferredoxin family protein [Bacteroidota bacterium]|nr:ferredoxin family protein [Bacteroidota bacterium]
MKSTFLNHEKTHTAFVQFNSQACTACWECIEACPNKVIDKSFLFIASTLIHEQVSVYDASECIGCLKCMQACEFDAISLYKQQ